MGISQPGIIALPRLLAVEVLLTEPESLGDDVLESCLYILRDRLRSGGLTAAPPGLRELIWPGKRLRQCPKAEPCSPVAHN